MLHVRAVRCESADYCCWPLKDESQSELHLEIQFVPRGKHSPSRLQPKPRCLLPLPYPHSDLPETLGHPILDRPTHRIFGPALPTYGKQIHSELFVSEDLNSALG